MDGPTTYEVRAKYRNGNVTVVSRRPILTPEERARRVKNLEDTLSKIYKCEVRIAESMEGAGE